MSSNPLMKLEPGGSGRVTRESLETYAEGLNGQPWVRLTGGPYFVNKRADEKIGVRHFLDRKLV